MKRVVSFVLIFCLLLSGWKFPVMVHAAEITAKVDTTTGVKELDKAMGDSYSEDPHMEAQITPRGALPSAPKGTIAKGVDLSHHDTVTDFGKLAKAVDFVIIRVGYGQDMTSQDDRKFEEHVKGCRDNNIPFGLYLYSYATTAEAATSEGAHALRQAKKVAGWGAQVSLPIYYDMEDAGQKAVSKAKKATFAKNFCAPLDQAGFTTGIYANLDWWNNQLTDSYFDTKTKWVAQYNTTCKYTKEYSIWQCAEDATVAGISNKCDYNYMIKNVFLDVPNANGPVELEPQPVERVPIKNASIAAIPEQNYTGDKIKPAVKVTYQGKKLVKGTDYTVKLSNYIMPGKATVKVTGMGAFEGTKTTYFYIIPSVPVVSSVKATSTYVKATWKEVPGASGYRVAWAVKGSSDYTKKNTTAFSKKITGLKHGKTYKVRVRSYVIVDEKKYYSPYTAVTYIKYK